MAKAPAAKKTKKSRRAVPYGRIYVNASFNNTIVTVTDESGDTIAASSSGANGFKGSRKSTPYAAQLSAESAMQKAKLFGLEKVDIFIKGLGVGRDQSLRGILNEAGNIEIQSITDTTSIPHGGCRKKKARRN